MRKLIIKKASLKNNIKVIKDRSGSAAIYAVLSGNGCGAGTAQMAQVLSAEGITRFAVSEVEEAEALREAGFVEEEILMLRATTDREELERLVDLNVVCTISSVDTGLALNALAENRSTVAEAHIQVDTGLGFGGFLVSEPEKVLLAYRSLPNVALSGIYTQLHAAGSYALMHRELARLDAVRAGSVLMGRCRRIPEDGLLTVGSGETRVAELRWLPKGHTIGADHSITLKKPTRVAILPVGYQHGLGLERPRNHGLWAAFLRWRRMRRMSFLIGGQRARIIGHIGATETVVNVTDLKCSAGDIASFDIDPMFAKGFVIEYR